MKKEKDKIKEKEMKLPIKERIENFLYSDAPSVEATKFLLMFLAMGGIVFGGAVVPGILKILKEFDFSFSNNVDNEEKYTKKQINNALSGLKRQKFIKIIKKKNGKFEIKLTNKGKKRVFRISMEDVSIRKPKSWDKKWRIVIFDVPNEFNSAREALRRKMKELGFKQLQKSVWIHPYECEDEILFVAEAFEVEKYVEIITAEKILHEKSIRKTFGL